MIKNFNNIFIRILQLTPYVQRLEFNLQFAEWAFSMLDELRLDAEAERDEAIAAMNKAIAEKEDLAYHLSQLVIK